MNYLWCTFPQSRKEVQRWLEMRGCWPKVVAPGLICSPGTRSCSGPFPFPRPASAPRGGFEPLASLPAGALPPCSQLLSVWVQRFPPQSRRRRQAQGGGATSGLGFLQPMPSSPGRPPGGGPSSPAPRSTVMAHGEGRTQGRTRAPSSSPSLLPASLLGNIPPRPSGDGDLSPPPRGEAEGQRMEARASPEPADPFLGAPPGPRKTGGCGGGGEGSRHNPFLQPACILASLQILK